MTGGAGIDVFGFGNTDSLVASADTITDYSGDTIDHNVGLSLGGDAATAAAAGNANISAGGLAIFHADDDTLAEKITAVAADLNGAAANTAGEIAFFEHDGDTYVFVTDAVGADTTGDTLIILDGVTGLTTLTIAAGDAIIA
jgi:hypothetical protein